MKNKNIIQDKSYCFALETIIFCRVLMKRREYILSKQLLKSGTSIGANIREAQHGQSRRDFVHKLSIALKEAHETLYWLELLRDSGYTKLLETTSLISDLDEIIALLTAIIKSTKKNL